VDAAAGPPVRMPGGEFFDTEEMAPTALRRLAASLAGLQFAVESADAAPTPDAREGLVERRKLVEAGLAAWRNVLASEEPKADRALMKAGTPPLTAE
ncbi:MAG TPA: hypothetical protein VMN04_14455, partial [Thermoanaerobaculia bacterium]|nr:hypothetical protein [Thermoanaerobaculia bacterium]